MTEKLFTDNENETLSVAAKFAQTLAHGDVVALDGELGVGKTVFVKGVAKAMGVKDDVTSPSFTLINEYLGTMPLFHMDMYRMNDTREMIDIGVEDYLNDSGVCFVEWAKKLGKLLPDSAILITIRHLGGTRREIEINRGIDQ